MCRYGKNTGIASAVKDAIKYANKYGDGIDCVVVVTQRKYRAKPVINEWDGKVVRMERSGNQTGMPDDVVREVFSTQRGWLVDDIQKLLEGL